jgi:hypothetical protein
VDLHEFLGDRLVQYLQRAQSGIGPERLPVEIAIDAGRVAVMPRACAPPPAGWFVQYLRAHGEPALSVDLQRARIEIARAETALRETGDRLGPARRDLEDAARAPSLAGWDGDDADLQGRPAIPPPWSIAIVGFVVVLVLTVAWQFTLSLLRGAGITPEDIPVEAWRRPVAVALPIVLALGASASLFLFVAAAIRRAPSILDELPARWHAHVLAGGTSLAAAVGLAWEILGRAGAAPGRATSFVVAITLPLAAPLLLGFARRLEAARAEAIRAAGAWDQAYRSALARFRRASAIVGATERECAAHEAARAAWAQRFYALRKRAAEAARLAAEEAEEEASELRQLSDAIVAALDLDRRAYVGAAPRGRATPSSDVGDAHSTPSALVLIPRPDVWEPTRARGPASPRVVVGDDPQHGGP